MGHGTGAGTGVGTSVFVPCIDTQAYVAFARSAKQYASAIQKDIFYYRIPVVVVAVVIEHVYIVLVYIE